MIVTLPVSGDCFIYMLIFTQGNFLEKLWLCRIIKQTVLYGSQWVCILLTGNEFLFYLFFVDNVISDSMFVVTKLVWDAMKENMECNHWNVPV